VDEQATFAPRSVLGRKRTGWNRLAVVVPALALAAIVWIGITGQRQGNDTAAGAVAAQASAAADLASPADREPSLEPAIPDQVLGIEIHRLDEIETRGLDPHTVVGVAGWYVATAITDCPPLAAIYRDGALPEVRRDIAVVDSWAFCERSGVLYASRPDLEERLPTNNLEDNRSKSAGLPAVAASLVIGVVAPPGFEVIGATATPVVVLGHFVDTSRDCASPALCRRELVVDYVGWAAGL
jgi:hypothetical protein